jgi:hypothetical protein
MKGVFHMESLILSQLKKNTIKTANQLGKAIQKEIANKKPISTQSGISNQKHSIFSLNYLDFLKKKEKPKEQDLDPKEEYKKFKEELSRTKGFACVRPTTYHETLDMQTKNSIQPKMMHLAMENYRNWVFRLTNEEIKNIRYYTNKGHDMLNRHLRGGIQTDPHINEALTAYAYHLHTSLSKARIPDEMRVYHRTTQKILRDLSFKKAEDLKGQRLHLKNFLSTSLYPNACSVDSVNDLFMSIEVPKGARGAYIAELSHYPYEHEILFDKGQTLNIQDAKVFEKEMILNCRMESEPLEKTTPYSIENQKDAQSRSA